jgi:hypothetical protein
LFRWRVNDYMPDELSPREAKRIVKKFCKPPYDLEEARLREAAWKVLQECKCGAFEWEDEEEEEENPKIKKNDLAGEAAKESKSILGSVKEYGTELIHNVQSLGAAGSVAFSSATYFQSVAAVESAQEVGAIVQTVENDYGQTLGSYLVEQSTLLIQKIPVLKQNNEIETEDDNEENDDKQTSEEANDSSQDSSQQSNVGQLQSGKNDKNASHDSSQEVQESTEMPEVVTEETPEEEADEEDIIKPHSMVEDDMEEIIYEPVFTPSDAMPASPDGPATTTI